MRNLIPFWLFLAIVGFITFGCSAKQQQFAIDSSIITVEASILESQYKQMEVLLRQTQEEKKLFSSTEWRTLNNVDATIDMLIMKYRAIIQLNTSDMSLADVTFMYGLAVEGYTQGRDVIYAHWEEFPPSTQILLNAFDKQAEHTSTRIQELLDNPDNESITQTLVLISGVLSLAVKMLGLVAL